MQNLIRRFAMSVMSVNLLTRMSNNVTAGLGEAVRDRGRGIKDQAIMPNVYVYGQRRSQECEFGAPSLAPSFPSPSFLPSPFNGGPGV